ncbi:hypothetical protein GGR16_005094 [Chelatococcus caeni]|uniref:Uncharacterized protein n=1 Tax=Chelatococcus caeni TaxID=1348468 RepID=A0A840C7M4_9HYPH|nr:hypothetical protein [Chelatococcus caeni]MBB4020032.1 hypothetical protein [Chelatococcus caeni]
MMPPITLTDEDGNSVTVNAARIRFVDRATEGGSFVTFKDGSERLFREEPDEVSRRIDEANGLPGTMPTHNHGRTVPAHRLGWKE